jgi:hypothetical protein
MQKFMGVDNKFHGSTRVLTSLGYGGRIELINADYTQYNGFLKNQADIVVSVAPQPGFAIDRGVEQFIKPGGTVLLLIASLDTGLRDDLTSTYGTKPGFKLSRRTIDPSAVPNAWGGGTVTTAIGVPLTSHHFGASQGPWEIFIPSW